MLRRSALLLALVTALLALWVGPAGAHVDLEPGRAVAGSTTELTFSFHHGRDGRATTALEVQLPVGAEVVEMGAVEGFTSSSDPEARTVRWEGGSVPDGVEGEFTMTVRLPDEPGVVLFPTIQETEAGELAWISEDEGEGETSSPAPRLTLVADPNAGSATTSTTEPTTTSRELPGTTLEAADDGDDDDAAPWLIGSGIAAALAIAVGGYLLQRRAG